MVNLKGYFWWSMSNLLPQMNRLVIKCSNVWSENWFIPHRWRHWITPYIYSTSLYDIRSAEAEKKAVMWNAIYTQHNVARTHFTHHLNVHTRWIVLKGVFTTGSVLIIIVVWKYSRSSSRLNFIRETDRGTRRTICITVDVQCDKVALYTWCAHSWLWNGKLKYVVKNTFREHL